MNTPSTKNAAKSGDTGALDALLTEGRRFPPSDEFVRYAVIDDPDVSDRELAAREPYWEGRALGLGALRFPR